ncbi:MAG: YicC/YloC family endoribonuclease [Phycisphaerae bacterium]|jgi:uncharacterized protein (TIGR00255 family)|nr:YicC/YloC family endoribonuclease [Phycisphaerae bacterium]
MLLSMTGFGAAQGKYDGVEYFVEAHSVNSRYFKASMKLPEVWSSAEAEIEKTLRDRLHRGSVMLSVRMKVSGGQAAYLVNTAAATKYIEQIRAFETHGGPALQIDLAAMLQLPGVCTAPPLDDLRQKTRDELVNLVEEALAGLIDMRKREGRAIEDDLLAQCDQIDSNLSAVTEWAPEVAKDYHRRLSARVTELMQEGKFNIDQEQLAREVAIFADRCDINEELSRLAGHVRQFRQACGQREPMGRKLEFVAQEMLREANTIGSKANDADITRAVVDMKTAIDRIKEQVQNIV